MQNLTLDRKKIAIIVGSGALPEEVIDATFENIADLFVELKSREFSGIICCGYIERPDLNFNLITNDSKIILEPILRNFEFGDEALFSAILKVFKDNKLEPISLKEIIPESFPEFEFLTRSKPNRTDTSDSLRGETILAQISPADLGQSVVVRNGLCMAVETSLGTDKMLEFLAWSANFNLNNFQGGVLYKAPKYQQNPFLDLPVIGENTIRGVKKAGLNGIVIKHSSVIVLKSKATIELANQLGIFIWSKK